MKTDVCLIVGRFQPMTKGHLGLIKDAIKRGLPVVICMIAPSTPNAKSPFPAHTLLDIYKKFIKTVKGIEDIYVFSNFNIITIGEELSNKYNIKMLICGADRGKDYKRITTNYAEEAHLDPGFELVVLDRPDDGDGISATKVRKALEGGDYKSFERMFIPYKPKECYEKLKSIYDDFLSR